MVLLSISSFVLLGLAALTSAAPASQTPTQTAAVSCAQNATEFAIEYGFPLGNYAQFVNAIKDGQPNTIYHSRELSTASSRIIVRPNVDTLYSQVYFDLSSSDVEFTIPDIKDRYYVFPFYDYYGNNYANVGTVNNAVPGKYLIRFTDDNFGPQKGDTQYRGYVNTPTTYGALLVRIVVKNNGTDQQTVNQIQDQIIITVKPRGGKPIGPALNTKMFQQKDNGKTQLENLLQLTAETSPYNQPEVVGDRGWVKTTLEKAGLKNGIYTKPPNVDLEKAEARVNQTIQRNLLTQGAVQFLNDGWAQLSNKVSGDFKSLYWARAFVAYAGYMQLTQAVALYPTWQSLGTGAGFNVSSDGAYLFTFSSRPPLAHNGFWSLTAYGEDQYLIPNGNNVYTLGDRSNLTYADGKPVYGSNPDEKDNNKPFQILVQPADIAPPANRTDNWLPAPAGGGVMSLNLRFYGPTEDLSSGVYKYPKVEKIQAIRA